VSLAVAVTPAAGEQSVSNGVYEVSFDESAGVITKVTNLQTSVSTPLDISWGWYRSSEGGCSGGVNAKGAWQYDLYGCSDQASGAYMFRPNSSKVYPCGGAPPVLSVSKGALVTEITQTFGSWCTHVVRLRKGQASIEVEWTAGPIPMDQAWIPNPPPPPSPGACTGWTSTAGAKLACTATVPAAQAGSCGCAGGKFDAKAGHAPFTCDEACAGRACVGWEQTANCGTTVQPSMAQPCGWQVPVFASGFCQCSMGRRVGSGAADPAFKWPSNGCNVPKHGDCNKICAEPPPADDWGKELIIKYSTGLKNKGVFETDANGREMVKRVTDGRGASYPTLEVHEPVAGNYYPINSIIAINDGENELAVVTDVSVGGSSLQPGAVELMLHRRVMADDSRGVQEPLNEVRTYIYFGVGHSLRTKLISALSAALWISTRRP
jgi:hypothetical protein